MWNSIVAGVTGHFSNRDRRFWTGPNSLLGKLGLGSDDSYSIPTRKSESEVDPILLIALAYFIFK